MTHLNPRLSYTTGTPEKPKEITGTARHALQKELAISRFSRKSQFFLYVRGHRNIQKSSYGVFRPAVWKCARGRDKNYVVSGQTGTHRHTHRHTHKISPKSAFTGSLYGHPNTILPCKSLKKRIILVSYSTWQSITLDKTQVCLAGLKSKGIKTQGVTLIPTPPLAYPATIPVHRIGLAAKGTNNLLE